LMVYAVRISFSSFNGGKHSTIPFHSASSAPLPVYLAIVTVHLVASHVLPGAF
jgi:hypothetical protein